MKIVVYNNKGGVGKTTLVAHVGFLALEKGVPLTVIDADRQGNCMSWLSGHSWDGESLYESGSLVVTTELIRSTSGITIIDAPPSFEFVENVTGADVWIIPLSSRFSVDGAMNVIQQLKREGDKAKVVLVMNQTDGNTSLGRVERDAVHKIGAEVFRFSIPKNPAVRKAEMMGRPIWDMPYGKSTDASKFMRMFGTWVLTGCGEEGISQ